MIVFISLLTKLLPLYLTIGLGFIASKYLGMQGKSIAGTMLYIITPVVIFSGVLASEIRPQFFVLPLIVWAISACMSFTFLYIGRLVMKDERANVLALSVGTGNTGYFGIPVALILFGPEALTIYILCMLGTTLNENSIGFYLAARGTSTGWQSFVRVLRLPVLYVVVLGIVLNINQVAVPEMFDSFFLNMRGAYTVIGMMIIGMGIAEYPSNNFDATFLTLAFTAKFLLWPMVTSLVCLADYFYLGFFDTQVYRSLFLVSITPLAANTVVIATLLEISPGAVATTTLLSTFFALFFIPAAISIMP